jgi:hypothetical protein
MGPQHASADVVSSIMHNALQKVPTVIMMPNSVLFYSQPQFRASSSHLAKLQKQKKWTLDTPGIELALALHYYRFEAYATAPDRDACCGPTANADVRYVKATEEDIRQNGLTIDDIACGHSIGHSHFEEVAAPLFEAAMARLVNDIPARPKKAGKLASSDILIARTRYTISAEAAGEWIKFPVEAVSVFEQDDRSVTDGTLEWLHNRLMLTASPSLLKARPS